MTKFFSGCLFQLFIVFIITAVDAIHRDLFEWIELEPLHFWHSLLFMDQDHFILIVSEFLYIPWKYTREQIRKQMTTDDITSSTPSITIAAAQNLESCVIEYLKGQVSSYFTEKLLRIVKDTLHHFKGKKKTDESSSHPQKGDAALEFIEHVCAVLSLDQNAQHDILKMRRNLLKIVRVKEFAHEAEFEDPCSSFTLPNVICSYCNHCRDLDLCRDLTLLDDEWRCGVPHCGQPYDKEQMENTLLQIVRQRERNYHLQDLVCLRCRQAKGELLCEQCLCGGLFKCKESPTEVLSKMEVFYDIAVRQKFHLLQECTSWILERSLQ